ncbi:MAG: DUF6145 family protein [Eubacteriales bacterium]|nr:DUF6145 family protein [Eubacteriales bacterium]
MKEENIICACSAYNRKFWFNPRFSDLPKAVQDELRVMSVLFTEDVGGIIIFGYDEAGTLRIETNTQADDYNYDTIGSRLKVDDMKRKHEELFAQLGLYYDLMKRSDG